MHCASSEIVADGPWVLDTSVVVRWFFTDEPLRDEALRVRAAVRDQPRRFVVPHLFVSELTHVLARKSGRDRKFVRIAVDLVLRLGTPTLALSESAISSAVDWACRGLSGYDATYVALAEDLGGRWLTADEKAADVAGRRAHRLGSWRSAPSRD